MKSWLAVGCALGLTALAMATACSSDSSDAGGAGPASSPESASASTGANGGGGAGGTGGTGGSVASSGSGGVSAEACDKMCDLFQELDCDGPSQCKYTCDTWVERAGDCGYQMLAFIDCIADSTEQCFQDVCQAEYAALDACAGGVDCFSNFSGGSSNEFGDYNCVGTNGCSTGEVRMECASIASQGGAGGESPIDCECFIGGRVVGTCVNDIENCAVDFNCCKQFW